MLNLQRLTIFAAVVEAGSFTAAATALGQIKAVVSFNIKQLEVDRVLPVNSYFHNNFSR